MHSCNYGKFAKKQSAMSLQTNSEGKQERQRMKVKNANL